MPLLFPSLERGNSPELYHSLRYWGLGVLARGEAPAAAARDKLKVVFLCAFCPWRETCMSSLLRHVTLFLSPEQSLPRLMSIEVVNAFLLHWLAAYIAADKPAHNWGVGFKIAQMHLFSAQMHLFSGHCRVGRALPGGGEVCRLTAPLGLLALGSLQGGSDRAVRSGYFTNSSE